MPATVEAQKEFINTARGKYFDPDGQYKFQCKDLIDAYCLALWGDWVNTIRPGNANETWNNYNPDYFYRIDNVVGDLNNFPEYGDIVVTAGDEYNRYGHIFINVFADAYTMLVLQQNADGTASTAAENAWLGYDQPGTGPVLGWFRPKVIGTPDPTPVKLDGILNGIDISMHQVGINIKATGAQFAIIKASEGVGYTDPALEQHAASLSGANIFGGFYHFARPNATPDNTPEAEAQTFLNAVRTLITPTDVVVLDWESDDVSDANWALRWLDIVNSALGRTTLIYGNHSWANSRGSDWDTVKSKYQLWLAAYPSNATQTWGPINSIPTTPGWTVSMWQYTSRGRLNGWASDLDLNTYYGGINEWGGSPAQVVPAPVVPSKRPNQCIVEAGDTLTSIANQFDVSLGALIGANAGIEPDWIYPGQVLNLPGSIGTSTPAPPLSGISQCVVEAGDTLSGIAAQFNVDLNELIRINGIADANLIYPGQVLSLPGGGSTAPTIPTPAVDQCIVEQGDTLSAIAVQFGVPLEQIIARNPGIDPDLIYPGQVLYL
jgi:LysM repeat protein/GH25 family lysozyme M1 (1,4-beta-N-acetylmuramidase)